MFEVNLQTSAHREIPIESLPQHPLTPALLESPAHQARPGMGTTFSFGISTVPFSKSSAVGFSVKL